MPDLVCPSCGTGHEASERFCRECGLPLVHAPGTGDAGRPLSEARERARKIRPQYSSGPLVRVASARHQAEAELIEGLLLEEGVPSVAKRTRGFDVPDFLASGPRDIFVPASGAEIAREVLSGTPAGSPAAAPERATARPWVQAMAVALAVLLVAASAAGIIVALF